MLLPPSPPDIAAIVRQGVVADTLEEQCDGAPFKASWLVLQQGATEWLCAVVVPPTWSVDNYAVLTLTTVMVLPINVEVDAPQRAFNVMHKRECAKTLRGQRSSHQVACCLEVSKLSSP